MKILHLSAQKPDSTGSGVYLSQTVSAFARMGHDQAVIAGISPEDNPHFGEGVLFVPVRYETPELPYPVLGMSNVMPYRATRYMDLTPEMTQQFKRAFTEAIDTVIGQFMPDLIICHHLYLVCAVMTHRIVQLRKAYPELKTCATCGLSHSTDIRQMLQIPLERDYIREGIHLLDRVYALHEAQAAEIVQVYGVGSERIRVIGTGYDANEFHECPGLRKPGTANVVYVGKICRKKGVESLLKAFPEVVEIIPDAKLTLIGGFSDQQEYDELVALSQQLDVPATFAGRLSQDDLVCSYNEADVFVLPSFFEGLPLVVIEALACGCKAVVTDLPGIKPWITKNVAGGIVEFVQPPRMHDVDTPFESDLPAFEARLAKSLVQALRAPNTPCNTTRVSWDALAFRML